MICPTAQCRLLPALVVLLALGTGSCPGQGTIVYGQFPATIPATILPFDSWGTRVIGELGFPAVTYDLVINGQSAFTFRSDGTAFDITPSALNAVLAYRQGPLFSPWAIPLQSDTLISDDPGQYEWSSESSLLAASRDIGAIGYFAWVGSGYIGLQFQQGGQTYYGWVRAGAPLPFFNGGWIYDYAYETVPNTPLHAGEGAVPEPSTFALLLLSGVAFWLGRKRP